MCPMDACKTIFTSAANFIRHFENGCCPGVSRREFEALVLAKHVLKEIKIDPAYIAGKLNQNKAAAQAALPDVPLNATDTLTEQDDTVSEYSSEGGVGLLDQDDDYWINMQPLQPEIDLIDVNGHTVPATNNVQESWPRLGGRQTPSVSGSEMSASDYASYITRPTHSMYGSSTSNSRRGSSIHSENYPALGSASSAHSVTSETDDESDESDSDAASDTTIGANIARRPTAWTTGASTKVLFPDAQRLELDEDEAAEILAQENVRELRTTRWWDADHPDFDLEEFRCADALRDSISYECPFPDCEGSTGYEDLDSLKAHLKHAHLRVRFICPAASCLRHFDKASSLIAHSESNGKCKVQASDQFKKLIDEISGGLLDSKAMPVPRIWRPEQAAVVRGNEVPVNGLMPTKFIAQRPMMRY